MYKPHNSLQGKTVVITGASSGVGRAAAEAFAFEKCNIVLAARGEEALEETATLCRDLGAVAMVVPTDVSNIDQVRYLVEKALQITGRIDIWINNAGVMATGKFEDMPVEVIDQVIKTNLLGYIHGARCVLPIFKEQKYGILINNISIGGWMPAPYGTAYSASKYGIRGMTECLQGEVSNEPDIHICGLYPSIQRSTGNSHSAKYSGLDFKIPPLASDPRELAATMVKMAKHPKKSVYTDWSSKVFKISYGLFPKTIINTSSAALRLLMKNNHKDNEGNILEPSKDPTRIYGETMFPPVSKSTKRIILVGAGIAGLMILLSRKK